jgi:hypothetical protein
MPKLYRVLLVFLGAVFAIYKGAEIAGFPEPLFVLWIVLLMSFFAMPIIAMFFPASEELKAGVDAARRARFQSDLPRPRLRELVKPIGGFVLAACGAFLAVYVLLLGGMVAAFLIPTYTHYAPGFSERAFAQIETGMSIEEVKALLGNPLEVEHPHCRVWSGPSGPCPAESEVFFYSRGRCGYKLRAVLFCRGAVKDRASFRCT